MTLTFFSNFLNHHQLPLCKALYSALGGGFRFVATTPFNAGAVSAGYRDMNLEYPFCLPAYVGEKEAAEARRLGDESDVVLSGGVADTWYATRLARNALTFRVSERPLKPLYATLKNPATLAAMLWRNTRYRNRNLYLLACGAHTAADFARVGAFGGKAYRWGYFPVVPGVLSRPPKKPDEVRLLWAGRMIGWKHPELALALAADLKSRGVAFSLAMVGGGELEAELHRMVQAMGLGEAVTFCGSMTPEAVNAAMRAADVYLFTSDGNEGWGAVLNEAMASGCAVLASSLAGATGTLVQDGQNGVVFDGTRAALLEKGRALVADEALRQRLGAAAFDTMHNTWNGGMAANRLLALCESLLGGGAPVVFESGPCSPV